MPIFDFKMMPFSLERCEDWLQPCKAPVERPSLGVRCGMFELIILLIQGSNFCVGILSSGLVARFELGPRSSEAGWDIYPAEWFQREWQHVKSIVSVLPFVLSSSWAVAMEPSPFTTSRKLPLHRAGAFEV